MAKSSKKSLTPASATTPMMRHFLEIKADHPDSLIFYRCGDFYETFYDDAVTAARELDITLTSRDKNSENPVPLAGVPYHAVQGYLSRLVDKGYKVAIVEQVEDPKQAKGMVKREVVRIVTPGLVMDGDNLAADENNFLVSIFGHEKRFGLALLDISTGEFRCTELNDEAELSNEMVKLTPREILFPDAWRDSEEIARWLPWNARPLIDYRADVEFDARRAEELLCRQFQTSNLKGFGVDGLPLALRAAGALMSYVQETQRQRAEHITALTPYSSKEFMVLDEATKVNLELERTILDGRKRGSLLGILDRCRTPVGSRTLKRWLNYPLMDVARIRERHNIVEEFFLHGTLRAEIRELLARVGDLSRLSGRITMGHGNARDLVTLKEALQACAELKVFLDQQRPDLFVGFSQAVDPLPDLTDRLCRAIVDEPPATVREGRMFKTGYHSDLDSLILMSEHGKDEILRIEAKEKKALGVPSLKVRYNRVFGYYIELTKSHADKAPAHYVRKQTLTNAERYITQELKEFEDQVLNAEDRRHELEYTLFEELRRFVTDQTASLMLTAETIGILDSLSTLAEVAALNDYVRPSIDASDAIHIEDGRHPVVEALQKNESFIPNDTHLDCSDRQLLLITGPNMAGKSTVIRQVALIALMSQIGSFVPARKADLSVVDRIFTRVGAADNLVRGLSTFMVEMTETANILHNATSNSLIILDEIGRGTSTYDGLSIAWAVAEYLHDHLRAKTMFATHYHELTELTRAKPRVHNLNISVREWKDQIIFLRKLIEGPANRSYGIQVGRLAGLPDPVIQRAKQVLHILESGKPDRLFDDRPSKRKPASSPNQLSLFSVREVERDHPIIDELDQLSPESLSPIEALTILFDWKKRRSNENP